MNLFFFVFSLFRLDIKFDYREVDEDDALLKMRRQALVHIFKTRLPPANEFQCISFKLTVKSLGYKSCDR